MSANILLGPLLGLESDTNYTICFLSGKEINNPTVHVKGTPPVDANAIAETPSGKFWRAEISIPVPSDSKELSYTITSGDHSLRDSFDRAEWSFYVPQKGERVRIAYASCNGFSSSPNAEDQYALWSRLRRQHSSERFSLLVMGGDQLYADEIWKSDRTPRVRAWADRPLRKRELWPAGPRMETELDRFYEGLYLRHWKKDDMSMMMASIPSIMMWDDHDIFDGWGSHPEKLQNSPVFRAIYSAASRYFELFQLRSKRNACLLNRAAEHYSFALEFRGYTFLALDNRSERTIKEVMSKQNWKDVKTWLLAQAPPIPTVVVLSGVPVVYRSFGRTETIMRATPWREELEDDIYDHWSALEHEGERKKLIMNLLDFKARVQPNGGKMLILSGDVHVGSLGVIHDMRNPKEIREIQQIVSSGIVHPPPSRLQWMGILAGSTAEKEELDGGKITTENLKPFGSAKFIRTRNYATLKEGQDGKLWVNWICEDGREPTFAIAST